LKIKSLHPFLSLLRWVKAIVALSAHGSSLKKLHRSERSLPMVLTIGNRSSSFLKPQRGDTTKKPGKKIAWSASPKPESFAVNPSWRSAAPMGLKAFGKFNCGLRHSQLSTAAMQLVCHK
jgi:hypothetical protein